MFTLEQLRVTPHLPSENFKVVFDLMTILAECYVHFLYKFAEVSPKYCLLTMCATNIDLTNV